MSLYRIIWDNGHASGALCGTYDDEDDAEAAGRDWLVEMCAIDGDDPDAEDCPYSYEVVRCKEIA